MKQLVISLTENSHPHAIMMAECIADMNLVVFGKGVVDWFELDVKNVAWWEEGEYFLCLPRHKDACLHWLNGGEIQFKSEFGWIDNHIIDEDIEWTSDCGFMRGDYEFRIKPEKVKKWIVVDKNTWKINMVPPPNQDCIGRGLFDAENIQFIEIEVEV